MKDIQTAAGLPVAEDEESPVGDAPMVQATEPGPGEGTPYKKRRQHHVVADDAKKMVHEFEACSSELVSSGVSPLCAAPCARDIRPSARQCPQMGPRRGGACGRPPKLEPAVVTHLADVFLKLCGQVAVPATTLKHVFHEAFSANGSSPHQADAQFSSFFCCVRHRVSSSLSASSSDLLAFLQFPAKTSGSSQHAEYHSTWSGGSRSTLEPTLLARSAVRAYVHLVPVRASAFTIVFQTGTIIRPAPRKTNNNSNFKCFSRDDCVTGIHATT